jgi:hypothetical protein
MGNFKTLSNKFCVRDAVRMMYGAEPWGLQEGGVTVTVLSRGAYRRAA